MFGGTTTKEINMATVLDYLAEQYGKSKGAKLTDYGQKLSQSYGQRQESYGPDLTPYALNQSVKSGTNVVPSKVSGVQPTPKKTTTSSSGSSKGYDASELLKKAGIDSSQKNALFKQYGVDNTMDLIAKLKKDRANQQADYEKKIKGEIEGGYNEVYGALDRMLAESQSSRAGYEGDINSMEEAQRSNIASQKELAYGNIARASDTARTQATSSLRDMEDDIRNSMEAANKYLGTKGAGDSSASYLASEALQRQAQKARGGILSARDSALSDIELQRNEIDSTANSELNKVSMWKAQALMDIRQSFDDRMSQLNMAKANATKEKAVAITNLIANSYQNFLSQLSALDNAALNYNSQIETWQMQRQAELEDYATKLSMSSQAAGGAAANAAKTYNTVFKQYIDMGFPAETANAIASSQAGLEGSYLTADMLKGIEDKEQKIYSSDNDFYTFNEDTNSMDKVNKGGKFLGIF